jgi:hypothetical protein
MRSTSSGAERGATVVEFLGVTLLVVTALMGLAQMAVWVWSRNVAVSAVHEGARTAAETGRAPDDGAARARTLLSDGLGTSGRSFEVASTQVGDQVEVRVRGDAPAIVPFLPRFTIDVRADALDEDVVGR